MKVQYHSKELHLTSVVGAYFYSIPLEIRVSYCRKKEGTSQQKGAECNILGIRAG